MRRRVGVVLSSVLALAHACGDESFVDQGRAAGGADSSTDGGGTNDGAANDATASDGGAATDASKEASPPPACPPPDAAPGTISGSKLWDGGCYFVDIAQRRPAEAEALCESLSGKLATFTSDSEWAAVKLLIVDHAWLGGIGLADGGFEWGTGEPVTYKDPLGDASLTVNDCLGATTSGAAWQPVPCSATRITFCEVR